MTTYKGLTVEIGADTKGLTSALRDASKGARETQNELKQVQRALKFNPSSTRLLTRQLELVQNEADRTRKRLEVLKAAEAQLGKDGMRSDQWTKLQAEIAAAEGKLESFNAQLAQARIDMSAANSVMGRFGGKLTDFGDKYGQLGQRVTTVGDAMTRTVTPAIVGVGAASIAAATSIDTSLTNVKKTVDGTEAEYAALKDSAIEFSKTNAVSASQVLDIQALGAQLGFTVDELEEFGRVASGLDIATNMDAETASTNMAQFANITKMAHSEISNYASALVGLGNSYATTESDISNMAMRLASAGTQVGMSQADILGLATALSSMGMEAEAGGSAVSTIMANIDKAVATGSEDMQAWASAAGMSADQFASAWKSSPVDALSAVLAGMEAATEEGGNMSLMLEELGISELRQTDAMKRLAGNASYLGDAVKTANEAWDANTALSDEVANRNESFAAKFEMLKNRAIAVGDQIGGPLADALLEAIDAAQPLFDAIESGAKAFAGMSKEEQQAVLQAIAFVTAAGPLLSIVGRIPSAASAVDGAFKGIATHFKAAADGGVKAGAGIGAAGAAFKLLGGTLAGVALAALGNVVGDLLEAKSHADLVKSATDDLTEATKAAGDAYASTSADIAAAAGDYDVTRESVDNLLRSQAELADKAQDTWAEFGTNAAMLDGYVATIQELADQSGLTAEEQAELTAAVQGFNDITGASVSVIDPVNGKLSEQADAILRVRDAYIEQAKAAAAQELLTDSVKAQMEASRDLEKAKDDLAAMEEGLMVKWGDVEVVSDEAGRAYEEQKQKVEDLEAAQKASGEAVDYYNGMLEQSAATLSASRENIDGFIASSETLAGALESSGKSASDFAGSLEQAGVGTSMLSAMSAEQLTALVENYDGTFSSIVTTVAGFGGEFAAAMQGSQAEAEAAASAAGQGSAQAWLAGFDQGTQQAVLRASELSGVTVAAMQQTAYEFGVKGNEATTAFANAISMGCSPAQAAAVALSGATLEGMAPLPAQMESTAQEGVDSTVSTLEGGVGPVSDAASSVGSGAVDSLGSGLAPMPGMAEGVANDTASALTPPLWGAAKDSADAGGEAGGGYAAGVESGIGPTDAAASSIASKTLLMKLYSAMAQSWGAHMGANFAGGLMSQVGKVSSAANALAQAAAGPLKHTTPDVGPLKHDDVWGAHLADNLAGGMRSGVPDVAKASAELASTVADYLAHTQPRKGPLSGGEWVYGYHAATNFADGLYAGGGAVGDAAAGMLEDADAEMQAYIDEMIAGWEDRADEMRETSTAIGDAVWGGIYGSVMNSPYRKPATGAVYDSMKVLESYGMDLDEYADKVSEFADKRAEWDSKLAGDMSETDWSSYNEWLAEYDDFAAMQGKLSASIGQMKEYQSLYALKDSAISGIDNAQRWSDALSALASKTGVVFNKEFVEAVKDGGDDYLRAIEQMADMSAEDAQRIIDSYQDLAIAQKQQELDQRSLYVNSLKYMTFETPKQRMVAFRETCLDVKEAIYSDAGLSAAFAKAGASVEGFAAELMAMDTTMADFASGLGDYTSAVSNGFSQFTKYGKTGLAEWEETLKLNMAESQKWADNLEAVFAKVPESIDSEAFRKAVYEGGFEQWGQVIADMAGKSSEQIADYINLYNQSIAQASADGINAFKALSPGEEMANAVIAGITAKQPELGEIMLLTSQTSTEAILSTAPEWNASGQSLAHEVAAGIRSQISAIASAAAATVSAALSAAHAAAGAAGSMPGVDLLSARSQGVPRSALAVSQAPRGFASTQRARVPSAAPTVNMSFTVNTRPGQNVDVRSLAREINTLQSREMRARGLR